MMAVTVVLTDFTVTHTHTHTHTQQGFHYMLLLKNMSTIEHVEKRDPTKKDQVNPFDLGKEKNWVQVKMTKKMEKKMKMKIEHSFDLGKEKNWCR